MNSKIKITGTIVALTIILVGCGTKRQPTKSTLDDAERLLIEEINFQRRLAEVRGLDRISRLDSVAKDLAIDMLNPSDDPDPLASSLKKRELQSVMAIAQVGIVYDAVPLEPRLYRELFFDQMEAEDSSIFLDDTYAKAGVSVVYSNCAVSAFLVLAQLADTTETGEAVPTLAGELWPQDSLVPREKRLFSLVNQERSASGRRKLNHDPQLTALARKYAQKMLTMGFFDHNEPSGKGLRERVISSNMKKYSIWGENLASLLNPTNPPKEAHEGLMNSPDHRQNIMASDYTHMGVGAATDGNWWIFVQLFAKE